MSKTKLTAADLSAKADELEAIQEQMLALIDQSATVLQGTDMTEARAKAYWLSHLLCAVKQENRYDTTMDGAIKELRGEDEDGE